MVRKNVRLDNQNNSVKDTEINSNIASQENNNQAAEKENEQADQNNTVRTKEKTTDEKLAELQDKYIRLSAEFDNYRKRTLKERMELIKTAGEDILVNFLPVLDDFERALKSMDNTAQIDSVKEGVEHIFNKLTEYLKQRGVRPMEVSGNVFDTDLHEAVSKIPAPSENLKGKVVDVLQKGYYLHDKVIRYAKVIVGE